MKWTPRRPYGIIPRVRYLECSSCKSSCAAASTFKVNGETLCEPCADRKVVEIQKAKGRLEVFRGKDPTICFKCSSDFGAQELPVLAGLHVCEVCRQTILDFRYPSWLKAAAAVLLGLLALSIFQGREYFVAGRAYYRGKKLLDAGDAAGAVPHFQRALKVAGDSAEVKGNAALALLKSGQPLEAYRVVEAQSFKDDTLYRSLQSEFKRWESAAAKAEEAGKLYSESKYKEAAQRMREAAAAYPSFSVFDMQATLIDSSAAFDAKDYVRMMELTEAVWNKYPGYDSASSLAGAYACVYASDGDEAMKEKALDMMAKAKTYISSKEEEDDLQEWEPRFNHRLQTRKILTKSQYDALFRGTSTKREGDQ